MGVKRLYTSSNNKFKQPFEAEELQVKIKESQTSLNRKRLEKVKVNRTLRKEIKTNDDLTVREVLELKLRIKQPSKNYLKEKHKLSKLYQRLRFCRKDYLHKATTHLIKSHDVICVEDLNLKGMTKSASGTIENPGSNVKQKRGLNRSLFNQGLGMFFEMLDYKAKWYGHTLVRVNPKNTSRTCSSCLCVDKNSRISQSRFVCTSCGFKLNADQNASRNILRLGIAA